MITKNELISEVPTNIIIDKALDKYSGKVLFPEKVAKAKSMLKGVELPKKKADD